MGNSLLQRYFWATLLKPSVNVLTHARRGRAAYMFVCCHTAITLVAVLEAQSVDTKTYPSAGRCRAGTYVRTYMAK